MVRKSAPVKKVVLAGAAIAATLGVSAPATAGGGYYYGGGYYSSGYDYYGHHHHRRRHHGGGGGKAAAIALGVIGGAIILNEVAEDRARDRYQREGYYRDRYYDGYYDGRADARRDRYDDRRYDAQRYEDETLDDAVDEALDDELYGGDAPERAAPAYQPVSVSAAYETCMRHIRRAMGDRGLVVTAPYRPDTVENRGRAVLMTATVSTRRGPDQWSRAMSCEADENKVYRVELL